MTAITKGAFCLFVTEKIIQELVKCTNLQNKRKTMDVTVDEFDASCGLLVGMFLPESCFLVNVNPMYHASMSRFKFKEIGRFDERRTREERFQTDNLVLVPYI